MIGAVIYVRVSDPRQAENLSLATQLKACEDYCKRQGFEILERFKEQGESAKTADRTELQRLLQYCRTHKGNVHFVVVFNLTRFAREKYDHFALRAHLKSLGISLRSATEPIDDTATGKLMEGVLAAFAQFDNDVRSDRTRAGMRAALELGRWTFLAPLGYLNAPRWSGKSLMPDPERAPLVQRAFERFATGRFTKKEVLAEITKLGLRTRRGAKVSPQTFDAMLENELYIGLIDVPEYGVQGQRGAFDPLLSEELFYRVQAVLEGRIRIIEGPRRRHRPEFPLRAFVRCGTCSRPLSGSYSKGRSDHYAYYHCRPPCRVVNVGKAELEGLFVDELARLQPTDRYMHVRCEAVLNAWSERKAEIATRAASVEHRTKSLQQKLDRLDELFIFDRAIDGESYERQKARLREELKLARIDRHTSELEEIDADGILAFAERVLPRASDLWVQATLEQRQRLQQLFFPDGIAFDGKQFSRTAVSTPAFNWLEAFQTPQTRLVALTFTSWNLISVWLAGTARRASSRGLRGRISLTFKELVRASDGSAIALSRPPYREVPSRTAPITSRHRRCARSGSARVTQRLSTGD